MLNSNFCISIHFFKIGFGQNHSKKNAESLIYIQKRSMNFIYNSCEFIIDNPNKIRNICTIIGLNKMQKARIKMYSCLYKIDKYFYYVTFV